MSANDFPFTPEPNSFDVQTKETKQQIQELTLDIKARLRRCAEDIICIGNNLRQIKQYLPHGQFRPWLKAEFGWSISAANKFMQVSKYFQVEDVIDIEIAPSALYVLASASTPTSVRQQVIQQAKQGQPISFTFVQQVVSESKRAAQVQDHSNLKALENLSCSSKNRVDERLVIKTNLSHTIKIYSFSDFNHYFRQEWRRMAREQQPLSLIICQIDSSINPSYTIEFSEMIRQITYDLSHLLHRPGDFVGYYGRGQWMMVLPNTDPQGTESVAIRCFNGLNDWQNGFNDVQSWQIEGLQIGKATLIPDIHVSFEVLIQAAQSSLSSLD